MDSALGTAAFVIIVALMVLVGVLFYGLIKNQRERRRRR